MFRSINFVYVAITPTDTLKKIILLHVATAYEIISNDIS